MKCTRPRTVGYKADGISLSWSPKGADLQYGTFQLPCGKCISCRLEYARQWAVRCVHEAQMHEENCFITLTYSDENLSSPKLQYSDFQLFMKKLRKLTNRKIGFFVTGEYGDKTKRPHWHAIIFNWSPSDGKYFRSNKRGDRIFQSRTLERLWGNGHVEIGSVTFESAGYCARYAAKKLGHGSDGDHDFEPISRKSNRNAIGKSWLERYWPDVFTHGIIVLRDGTETSVPRYYEKWFKENHPEQYLKYLVNVKLQLISKAEKKENKEKKEFEETVNHRLNRGATFPLTRRQVQEKLTEITFNQLQEHLKL